MQPPASSAAGPGAANGAATVLVRRRRRYRAWALFFLVLGGLLLAYSLGGPLAPAARGLWPLGLVAAGAGLMAAGQSLGRLALPSFAIHRGAFDSAQLHIASSLSDIRVAAFAGASQLAVGEFASYDGPQVRTHGGRAHLTLADGAAAPLLFGDWSVALTKALPWTLEVDLGLGHASLDLRDLTVAALHVRSTGGDVELTLPGQGAGAMEIRLLAGDLRLNVPHGLEVKVRLDLGPLARARVDEQRFPRLSALEWATPGFSAAPGISVRVSAWAGDVSVK